VVPGREPELLAVVPGDDVDDFDELEHPASAITQAGTTKNMRPDLIARSTGATLCAAERAAVGFAPLRVERNVRHRRLSYVVLRAWARSALYVFYRSETFGRERVPTDRPVIFAANHSNALGDVAVVVASTPKFPHFLATETWWKRRPVRLLFELGGVLPVRRRADGPDPRGNEETFAVCFRALAAGAHLVIFPEGVMHPEPELLPLKTGAARIAIGASAHGTEVAIVPVGLVYEERGRWRSHAVVRFGEPIFVDERCDVRALTDRLAAALQHERAPGVYATSPARPPALLAVPAAFGFVANAPVLVVGLAARAVPEEMWHATIKGVGGTLLLPLTWVAEIVWLSRRVGVRRAALITMAGAISGLATLAWIDRDRDQRQRQPDRAGQSGAPPVALPPRCSRSAPAT
jgi:1-acyl-sn-glycerol-3-phosphate acyltransferase